MTDGTNPGPHLSDEDVDRIARRVAELLRASFLPELAKLDRRHDWTARRLDEIARMCSVIGTLAEATWREDTDTQDNGPPAIRPDANTPIPLAIHRACAMDPSAGVQRLHLVEFGGLTLHITPGSDPARVWQENLDRLTAEEDDHESDHPRSADGG